VSFAWPLALLALLAVPLLLGAYLWQLRRKRKQAVRFSSVALIRAALPARSRWRRHVPVALLLASITGLGIAAARPRLAFAVPLDRTSIILALDVSRSMCATDVAPNRLTVAQDAARAFVKDQAAGTRIGIIAFSGFAEVIAPPTTNKKELLAAIDNLTTSRGTAIGTATLKAIDAIAETNTNVRPTSSEQGGSDSAGAPNDVAAVADGNYEPDIVVLLTDGANTRGIGPVEAAQQAVDRRIRVYTIGFGTTNPTAIVCTRQQLGGDGFGGDTFGGGGGGGGAGPGGGGRRSFLVIDEPTLTQVAQMTGGTFHRAEDAAQLRDVFANLPKQVVLQRKAHEVSVAFAALGAVLALAAVGLSLLWNRSP
jgi:Ca-activated chloride channel homolog